MADAPRTGRCLCGAVRYEVKAEPTLLYACHCTDCQTATGSAFVLAMRVPVEGVPVAHGPARPYVRARSDGRKKQIVRCSECLTALWSESLPAANYVTIYAGTLDDSAKLVPNAHLWTEDAQPWIVIPTDVPAFVQGPPDMAGLVQSIKSGPRS